MNSKMPVATGAMQDSIGAAVVLKMTLLTPGTYITMAATAALIAIPKYAYLFLQNKQNERQNTVFT